MKFKSTKPIMFKSDDLISWSLANKKKLNLKIKRLEWPSRFTYPIWDYTVQITLYNQTINGRGSDKNEQKALVKALSEAFERCLLYEHSLSHSNGLAAAPTWTMAQKNAKSELIERDLFFCHYLTQSTPKNIFSLNRKNSDLNPLYKVCSLNNLHCEVYSLGQVEGVISISIFIYGFHCKTSFGLIMGLGASSSFKTALKKAIVESLRSLSWILFSNKDHSLSLTDFRKQRKVSPETHIKLALNTNYAKKFIQTWGLYELKLKNNVGEKQFFDFTPDALKIHVEELFLNSKKLQGIPLKFCLATSDQLQNPFWGYPLKKYINWQRIHEFQKLNAKIKNSNKDINILNLNQLPHPMG